MSRPVGAHVFVSGGLERAVHRAVERGCDALQVFPSNPRGWAIPDPDPAEEERFRDAITELAFPLFVHAPYLVNLASTDPGVVARSHHNLRFALARAGRIGARAVIVHAGQGLDADRPEAIARLAGEIHSVLDAVEGVALALELTASGRCPLARTVDEVTEILDVLGWPDRVRVCVDTCHLWAAGCDFSTTKAAAALAASLRTLGPERVAVVHVNDSHDPLGSRRDHHANLGAGTIPPAAFRRFLQLPELAHAPAIVETPATAADKAADVALVREFSRGRSRRGPRSRG